jgi:hypothetical protein
LAVGLAALIAFAGLGLAKPGMAFAAASNDLSGTITVPAAATSGAAASVAVAVYDAAGTQQGTTQTVAFAKGDTSKAWSGISVPDGLYVLTGTLTGYGVQSKVLTVSGAITNADLAFAVLTAGTTVTVNLAEQLTLAGGDPHVTLANTMTGGSGLTYTSAKVTPMTVVSNAAAGCKLTAATDTTDGALNLDHAAAGSTDKTIPWGDTTNSNTTTSAWHVQFALGGNNDTGFEVAAPFSDDTTTSGYATTTPVIVAKAKAAGNTTSGLTLTPSYSVRLHDGLNAGQYAATITYTLSAGIS